MRDIRLNPSHVAESRVGNGGFDVAHAYWGTIMGYLKKDELPPVVAIACRALARDKHVLAAHYVPARKVTRPAA